MSMIKVSTFPVNPDQRIETDRYSGIAKSFTLRIAKVDTF